MFPLRAFYWGHSGARHNFLLQIRNLAEAAYRSLGEKPVIIGECGVPMDMKYVVNFIGNVETLKCASPISKGEAFENGDWTWQSRMMDAMLSGLEQSLIGYT